MQRLTVNGFLGIDAAQIDLDRLTVLIGPQASGKSVVARLLYFFLEYFAGFNEFSLYKNEHKKTYDARKRQEFCQIFPRYSWEKSEFNIRFDIGDANVEVTSRAGSEQFEFRTSADVAKYFRELKSSFKTYYEAMSDSEQRFGSARIIREFRRLQEEMEVPRYESPLFVPAARSFYSTIREEIFSILSIDEKIDKITMQFGEFYETNKALMRPYGVGRSGGGHVSSSKEREYFEDIVKGNFVREDNRDWIEMKRGRIELSRASSGQQEAVPLLVALLRYPRKGRTLIIEEPEAHLFPDSQAKMLSLIVRQVVERDTSILFTTHSPYLLAALNNFLLKGEGGITGGLPPSGMRAYALNQGRSESIIDNETGLVAAGYIDSVSEKIEQEFLEILESQSDR